MLTCNFLLKFQPIFKHVKFQNTTSFPLPSAPTTAPPQPALHPVGHFHPTNLSPDHQLPSSRPTLHPSPTFLRYIRKQVQEFSVGVSARMTRNKAHHCTPDPSIISPEDPRMSGHLHNFSTRGNLAMGGPSSAACRPAISLHA